MEVLGKMPKEPSRGERFGCGKLTVDMGWLVKAEKGKDAMKPRERLK